MGMWFAFLSNIFYLYKMKHGKIHIIIHGFALLHLAVCLLCQRIAIPDTLILTLLTMAMVVLLCMEENLSIAFTAITIVLANILGFILGNALGSLLGINALSTFITTEILGWGVILMVALLKPARVPKDVFWKDNAGWLVAAVVIVFGLRVSIDIILSHIQFGDGSPTMRLIAEVAAFCLLLLIFFVLYMRNQMELEREKNRNLEKALLYSADSSAYREKFIVHLNNRILPIHVKDIAYIFAESKSTFIVTSSGVKHILDESLDTAESQLDPVHFFRISRSCIIEQSAISSAAKIPGGRVVITPDQALTPPLTDLTVSRARVQAFLEWFEK